MKRLEKTKAMKQRGRPSEKDKEGLPESKKVKKFPRKKKNLKIMSLNNNGKPYGFSKLLKKKKHRKVYLLSRRALSGNSLGGCGSGETRYILDRYLQEMPCLFQGCRGDERN